MEYRGFPQRSIEGSDEDLYIFCTRTKKVVYHRCGIFGEVKRRPVPIAFHLFL